MPAQIPIERRLAFTGHRQFAGSYDEDSTIVTWIKERLAALIEKAVRHGYKTFVSGGALGLDTWAAEEVIRQRDAGADIHLVMAIPCTGQDVRWTPESRERYRRILKAADCVHFCSKDSYEPGCMDIRDRWMLDNVSTVLAFQERKHSGTGRAVDTALSLGRKVVIVDTRARTCRTVTSPA